MSINNGNNNVLNDNVSTNTIIDRVMIVDEKNQFFITGDCRDVYSQILFHVSPQTKILDQSGNRIRLGNIRRGQIVRVKHAKIMTLSIPPQTSAYCVQIINERKLN